MSFSFHSKFVCNLEVPSFDQKFLEKAISKLGMRKFDFEVSLEGVCHELYT
jgi:hypothetical protein